MKPISALALLVLGALACSGPRGRILSDTDPDLVGNRRAGAAVYDRAVNVAVDRILKLDSAARNELGAKLKVASMPVENASGEELVDWADHIYELIDTSINRSERYENISIRFIRAALQEARLVPTDLFVPRHRREFLNVLKAQGQVVDALLFPKLTRGSTVAGGETQRDYQLILELVDVKTGHSEKVSSGLIRKAYVK